jgi:hypothetical protein
MNDDERRKFLWLLNARNPEHSFELEGGELRVYGPPVEPDPALLTRRED